MRWSPQGWPHAYLPHTHALCSPLALSPTVLDGDVRALVPAGLVPRHLPLPGHRAVGRGQVLQDPALPAHRRAAHRLLPLREVRGRRGVAENMGVSQGMGRGWSVQLFGVTLGIRVISCLTISTSESWLPTISLSVVIEAQVHKEMAQTI